MILLAIFVLFPGNHHNLHSSEVVVWRCSVEKVFLEISQNSQENTCARASFLIKFQARSATSLKKRPWHRCFPMNFLKFLRTPFLQNTSGRLLLYFATKSYIFKTFLVVCLICLVFSCDYSFFIKL